MVQSAERFINKGVRLATHVQGLFIENVDP